MTVMSVEVCIGVMFHRNRQFDAKVARIAYSTIFLADENLRVYVIFIQKDRKNNLKKFHLFLPLPFLSLMCNSAKEAIHKYLKFSNNNFWPSTANL